MSHTEKIGASETLTGWAKRKKPQFVGEYFIADKSTVAGGKKTLKENLYGNVGGKKHWGTLSEGKGGTAKFYRKGVEVPRKNSGTAKTGRTSFRKKREAPALGKKLGWRGATEILCWKSDGRK